MEKKILLEEVYKKIPHRYPFLLIDKIIEYVPHKSARGLKAISLTDPIFQGHFPNHPVYPGVLILEALGQLAAFACSDSGDNDKNITINAVNNTINSAIQNSENNTQADNILDKKDLAEGKYLARIDRARFLKPVHPGDTIELNIAVLKIFGSMAKVDAVAKVNSEIVASAELTFTL